MSFEEDIKLKDLLMETLNANGSLAKIRAELRANVFLALDDDVKMSQKRPILNNKVKSALETTEGQWVFSLVHEFLEFYNLDWTLSVYEPESYANSAYTTKSRNGLSNELALSEKNDVPLLLEVLRLAQVNNKKKIEVNLNFNNENNNSLVENSQNSDIIAENSILKTISEEIVKITENNDLPSLENPLNETYYAQQNNSTEKDKANNTYEVINQNLSDLTVSSPRSSPVLKKTEFSPLDKQKTPQKPKNSLNNLSDLPPLQKGILPSLYNKDFDKKELEKLFDMEAEYEEDFISESKSLEFTHKSDKVSVKAPEKVVEKHELSNSDLSASLKSKTLTNGDSFSKTNP